MATILIVDDEPSILFLLRIALEAAGHDVIEAPDGAAALERFSGSAVPDAVVTDVMMPGMDGRELIRRLRRDPATRAIPIVVQSAVENPPGEADAVLRKPVDPSELADLVGRLLGERGG